MCGVGYEEISCATSDISLLSMDEDSQWVACGRKIRHSNDSLGHKVDAEEPQKNDSEPLIDLPLELCDPMRRKITSLKPSLTPGAGTRVIRRRKRRSCLFVISSITPESSVWYMGSFVLEMQFVKWVSLLIFSVKVSVSKAASRTIPCFF